MIQFDPSKPVAIVGAGVMGTKVAWACARAGLETRLFDVVPGKAEESRQRALTWGTDDDRVAVEARLSVCATLDQALESVQLAFENVPERLELKRQVLAEVSAKLPEGAYVGSNASAITATPLAQATAHPERFFNLNFTDPRTSRLVELMTADGALEETGAFAEDWAKGIGMIPVRVGKEQLGYAFNRLWRAIKKEVLRQIQGGYTTAEDIDRAWMLTFGTDMGPCAIMDDIGLHSVAAVERVYYDESGEEDDLPPEFLVDMVDRGELGVVSGRGFYTYPDPAYAEPGFLEGD